MIITDCIPRKVQSFRAMDVALSIWQIVPAFQFSIYNSVTESLFVALCLKSVAYVTFGTEACAQPASLCMAAWCAHLEILFQERSYLRLQLGSNVA